MAGRQAGFTERRKARAAAGRLAVALVGRPKLD
jgi:hypothetical protein